MFELKFTKFFDVKSPLGVTERENYQEGLLNSIGVDIYFPKITKKFFDELLKSNPGLTHNVVMADTEENPIIYAFQLYLANGTVVMDFDGKQIKIFRKIQIPSGIGIIIPEGYHMDLRSKSGNFKNGFTSITGLIDEDYTYSFGIQIKPLEDSTIYLEQDEKVSQIVLHKSNFIAKFEEVELELWDKLPEVQIRRRTRTGGFGHTGKFDA